MKKLLRNKEVLKNELRYSTGLPSQGSLSLKQWMNCLTKQIQHLQFISAIMKRDQYEAVLMKRDQYEAVLMKQC